MYKFLVRGPDHWYFTAFGKMDPPFSNVIKDAILLGYWSKQQRKWITSGTAIQLRENYETVKRALPDSELTMIMLSVSVDELNEFKYNYGDMSNRV